MKITWTKIDGSFVGAVRTGDTFFLTKGKDKESVRKEIMEAVRSF
jgi:hypothetical protein